MSPKKTTSKSRPLAGKVALVTGGAKRLGKEIVLALADAWAAVAIHVRESGREGKALAKRVTRAGGRAVVLRADLRDPGTFFAIQQFRMQDKDVIYVSNSTYADIAKFLILVNGISNTTANVPANMVVAKESIQALNK